MTFSLRRLAPNDPEERSPCALPPSAFRIPHSIALCSPPSGLRPVGCARWVLLGVVLLAGSRLWGSEGQPTAQAAFPNSAGEVVWDTGRGHFRLTLGLEPAAGAWEAVKAEAPQPAGRQYQSGPYRLRLSDQPAGRLASILSYELTRADGQPFRKVQSRFECKTSYSGVYKIFDPGSFSQQNYKIDLPFHLAGTARAEIDQPVIWMEQTDGRNTLTLGLLEQTPLTTMDGSTYDTGNGGEAPGIANSYVRVAFTRPSPGAPAAAVFKESLYVNADGGLTWFEALERYAAAVDAARGFQPGPSSPWALNPMWHSWYAHADQIDEAQIRDDARRAKELGATTIELDAGWNMPREAGYSFDNEGDYDFDPGRFPDAVGMIEAMHAAGQRVVLHVAPLVMGKNAHAWAQMKDCLVLAGGKPDGHLDPRLKKVHQYLLASWERMFTHYHIDGLWYDFLEIPARADPPPSGQEIESPDLHAAYTRLMEALFAKSRALDPNAVVILRRPSANLNAKSFCTHVWPMDTPQDYNMNRRDVVYMKTFGPGVLTHACCTSWAISESELNVARQMASIVLAGVPAFSVKLAQSPAAHNAIVRAWLAFYEPNKTDLVLGRMTPLLPTPPSAALRIEGEKQAFFGFFEAVPGLIEITRPVARITLVNAFSQRTATRLEGVSGEWEARIYDQTWQPAGQAVLRADAAGGLSINCTGPTACHSVVLTKRGE